jgi:O-antigen/teichoic acid export membrane protein
MIYLKIFATVYIFCFSLIFLLLYGGQKDDKKGWINHLREVFKMSFYLSIFILVINFFGCVDQVGGWR